MLSLPRVAGSELIDILKELGFRATASGSGLLTLARGWDVVVVPERATLSPALVGALLRSASVDPLNFLRAFEGSSHEHADSARGTITLG